MVLKGTMFQADGGNSHSYMIDRQGSSGSQCLPVLMRSSSTGNLELNLDLPSEKEDTTALTKSLQRLSTALTNLKATVSPQPSPGETDTFIYLFIVTRVGE